MTNTPTVPAPGAAPLRMERMRDLEARVGLRKSQIFALIRDGEFPQPVKLGRASAFVSAEVDAWLVERMAQRGKGKR